jgi:methionyl-tRNA formyltransferase
MKITFIGTGKFGSIVLEGLTKSKFKPDIVVCPYDKPAGRKKELKACQTKEVATSNKLKVLEIDTLKEEKNITAIKAQKPDLIIVADTNFILPEAVLTIPKYGCLNVHPSLLPRYRGPSPLQAAIFWGQEETGVTIIKMDEKIDHGPIITQKAVSISSTETFETLKDKLAKLGAEILIKALPRWIDNKIEPLIQNDDNAIYTKKFKKEDGKIDWKGSAIDIDRMIRAYNPWPGTFTFFSKKQQLIRLKVIKAKAIDLSSKSFHEGRLTELDDKTPAVLCSKGKLLLEEVQVEGKTVASGQEFLNGYRGLIGSIFTSNAE